MNETITKTITALLLSIGFVGLVVHLDYPPTDFTTFIHYLTVITGTLGIGMLVSKIWEKN